MEIRNCKECGRLFNYIGGRPICPACKDRLEDKFREVKEYIRSNVNANIQQVSDDMEVSVRQIKQWVREERLCFSPESMVTLECENCGAPVRTGKYCKDCLNKLQNSLQGAIDKPKMQSAKKTERDGDRMRFLDMD